MPLVMPARFNCWGCAVVTGAFMFFQPRTEAHIVGSFNDSSYRSKAPRYVHGKAIRPLLACR